ncbi:MAG TPA: ABC transporter permease [Longimicrobiales bacterium]|nr:ABC transporter permease [Longimicrobiales bacterium]
MSGHHPPRLVERALERMLPPGLATDGTLGDLAEEFDRRARRSHLAARVWYLGQAASLVLHHGARGRQGPSAGTDVWMDLRWSLRMFTRHPGFALGVVAVLGLGLGANAAVFSVVDGTFRNASWWSAPERTVTISPDAPFSFGQMELYREDTEAYRAVGGFVETAFALALPDGGSRSVNGVRISPALFGELAVQPVRGRGLAPEDAWIGVEPVVIVGTRLWHEVFGGDLDLVGGRVELGGVPHTVVGIQGAGGRAPGGLAELWVPLVVDPREDDYFRAQNLTVVGVLADGASPGDAQAELVAFNDGLTDMWPGFYPEGWSDGVERVAPANEVQRRMVATPLLLLLGGTGLLLLVTALNVGNLLLGRAIRRRRELAVRASIGAGRGRIVTQLLVEGAVLTLPAVLLGLWVAGLGAPFIADLFVGEAIVGAAPTRSAAVLAFVAAVGCGAWLVLSGIPIGNFLAHGMSGLRGNTLRGTRVQQTLVSVQAGLATILLVSATLLTRTVDNLRSVPLGFDPQGLVAIELSPTEDRIASPAAGRAFYGRIVDAVRAVPGVREAGVTGWLPLRKLAPTTPLNPEAEPVEPAQALKVPMQLVDPGFFAAMGIEPLEGRVLDARDQTDGPSAVVVNASLAALLWPDGNAVGQRIAIDPHDWRTFLPVVGVVPDVRSGAIKEAAGPAIYTAIAEQPVRDLTVVVRAGGDLAALGPALRSAIEAADPVVPVRSITRMTEVVRGAYAISWIVMGLLVVLAVLATGLGALGIYAVLAQHVAASRRDMGVRMALGAEPRAVVRHVVRSGVALAGAGVLAGCLGAALGTRLLRSMLFEVSALSPGAYLAPAVTLGVAAVLAAWIPALRAGRLAPAEVLRAE